MTDNKGQISAEFLFLFGVLIVIIMISAVFISDENELNTAMSAARNGANELIRALLEKDISLLNLTTIDGVSFNLIMLPFISLLLMEMLQLLSYSPRTLKSFLFR